MTYSFGVSVESARYSVIDGSVGVWRKPRRRIEFCGTIDSELALRALVEGAPAEPYDLGPVGSGRDRDAVARHHVGGHRSVYFDREAPGGWKDPEGEGVPVVD